MPLRVLVVLLIAAAASAEAGQTAAPSSAPRVPQETMSRDATGRLMLRAVALDEPLRFDGQLDDAIYSRVAPITGFIQADPSPGEPATEKTELWILYDKDNLYVGARMWESQPERMVVNEMRHDANIMQNENFTIFLDTFHDGRNGVSFIVNPIGARSEGQTTNGQYSRDWNAIWDAKPARFAQGWTAEMQIPFKSLRYAAGRDQVWGFNARRIDRWKNELSHLSQVPTALGQTALYQASYAATLAGLETPSTVMNLDIKPYAVANLATDVAATPRVSNRVDGDVGVDVKYGITKGLTADLTYHTDFAQAEADEQQINLTRFSLFFPEKRDFFLENAGLFTFGRGGGDVPILFYSRRIGLDRGRVIPIVAGARVTGRAGRYTLGLVNMQAAEEGPTPSTNFSVVRLRRDILRKSSIGVVATGRSVATNGVGSNLAYGADGAFAFYQNLSVNTYWARTRSETTGQEDQSYRAQLDYNADRYGLVLERLVVGRDFNPEVGFVRRADMRRYDGSARFSPRPRVRAIRKLIWTGSMEYTENGNGRLETRNAIGEFALDFQNSDRFEASYTDSYEFLPAPFRIAPGIVLPVGAYDSSNLRVQFDAGQHRPLSGQLWAEGGAFYDGNRTAVGVAGGRAHAGTQLSLEPTLSVNWVDLEQGSFSTTLLGSRIIYTMTPWMFTSALVQYNSINRSVSTNLRLRWEYRPGSELFVVYNEERNTSTPHFPGLSNRALILKVNRLFRF